MSKPKVSGGVRVSSNTSMEPTRTIIVPVEVHVVESSINAGFQIGWIDGEAEDGTTVSLSAGAGCGSKWGTIRVNDISMVFDGAQFLNDVADAVLTEEET